ncbi:MAG: glycoside hydrolase family 3 protein, partial [Anaerolineae bacterium]|nr:glycoside hydrolase family 3 protein [Anaerolineae bacterium]
DLTPADTSSRVQIQLANFIQQRHARTTALQLPFQPSEQEIAEIIQAAEAASIVIVGTINADENQAALVRTLYHRGKMPIVVALRTPYDLNAFPMIETYLCSYGIRPVSMKALARVLWGEIEAQGVLPCNISPAAV